MMTNDMGSVLQQALATRGGAAPEPTQVSNMEVGGQPVEQESFQPEEIAEQLEAVKTMMETTDDPGMLQQLKDVAEALTLALESASAAVPQQIQTGPDPSMGMPPAEGQGW